MSHDYYDSFPFRIFLYTTKSGVLRSTFYYRSGLIRSFSSRFQ